MPPRTASKIVSHQIVRDGPTLYRVQGNAQLVTELELDHSLTGELLSYKTQISGRSWSGHSGVFYVSKILSHRWMGLDLYYFVSWFGEWNHQIWNSEVHVDDMIKEKMLEDYNKAHAL